MKLTPITIHGDQISVEQLDKAIQFMKAEPFRAHHVVNCLQSHGVRTYETAYRGADRLIQKCRKSKLIQFSRQNVWNWIGPK